VLQKLREYLERFYPSEPVRITVSKIKIFLLIVVIGVGGEIFYLRVQNKNELDLLRKKHEEIQLHIKNYLYEMSHASGSADELEEIKNKYEKSKKQLSIIKEKIDSIKNFWFLD